MKHLKKIPTYQIKQIFLNTRLVQKDCAKAASKLKNSIDCTILAQSLLNLFKTTPAYIRMVWGNLFPKSIEELGDGNGYFFKPESLINEINWIYIQISKNKHKLKFYVNRRNAIERLILLAQYDEAMALLEESVKELGYSIWYFETKMLIYSYSGKEESIYKMISEINEKKKDTKTGFVPFLLHYLFKRCSKTYSAFNYDAELASKFKMNRNDFQKERFNYYLFRLNFYKHYGIKDLSATLIMESTNSLIDRYNILLFTLKASFSSTVATRQTFANIAVRTYRHTQDNLLIPFVAYTKQKNINKSYFDAEFLQILDLYYTGSYRDVLSLCKRYVKNKPSNFDVVKIYCRSLIFLRNGYSPICIGGNSILNDMTHLIFSIMNEKDNDAYIFQLYDLNKNIYGFSIACGLDYFIKEERNEKYDDILRFLSLEQFDPLFTNLWDDDKDKLQYLQMGKKYLKDSKAISYQTGRVIRRISDDTTIASYIRNIDNAKVTYDKGNYGESIKQWQNILLQNKECLPIAQSAVEYIYNCYLGLGDNQNAIKFYVDQYIDAKVYISRVNTDELIKNLHKAKYKNGVRNTLDLQLFVFLNTFEDEQKACVLERFCAYKDIEEVSRLIDELKDEGNKEKVELFFYLIASEDILRHMVYVNSTKKMLEEQQKLTQYLSGLKTPNHNLYDGLNQELLDAMIVYQNIKKMDESKIFANDTSIVKYELKDYTGLYNQYKYQLEISKSVGTLYLVDATRTLNTADNDPTIIKANVKLTNKAINDVACQIFDVIRDKFLMSKFGLKTYLSTRIRHGVFEGEIRSGFDRLNLVLSTEHDFYIPTTYWTKNYGLDVKDQQELMKILESFSRGINHLIANFKEEVLQIKLSEKEKGMFDYRVSEDDMCYAVVQADGIAKNYDEFCLYVMQYLLQITEKSLVKVREEVNGSLTNSFKQLIDQLENDIQKLERAHFYEDLKSAVNNARADINGKLTKINNWFHLQDAKFDDFSLSKQIEIVWNVTSKMYPNILCNVKGNADEIDIIIKSSYYIHISDMLTIFYNNMFSYSKQVYCRTFVIETYVVGNKVQIHLENDIKESEDLLNAKFKEMLSSYSRLQLEGMSGLVKVKKIIKYDLGCEANEVQIKAENGKCLVDVFIDLTDLRV